MWPRPCRPRLVLAHSRTHIRNVRNRIPLAIKLPHLLGTYVEHECDPMIALRRLRLHRWQIQPAPRSRIQNAHQRPLRIAITNVKSLHGLPLVYTYSSNTISDNAAPAGTIGKTLASGAQSKTSNSGSGDRRNRSIKSPVSLVTGYSRKASSLSRPALIRYAFAISTKSGLSLRSVSA